MYSHVSLQVIGSGILVLLVWAKRADIAGGGMYKTVSDHLVPPLESLTARTSRAILDRAEVRPLVRVHVSVAV